MGRVAPAPTMRDLVEPIVRDVLSEGASAAYVPLLVSQRSSLAVLGLPPRNFLELVRRPDCPAVVRRVGKLRLVDARQLATWIDRIGARARGDEDLAEVPVDEADRFLRELGFRDSTGGRR